MPKVERIAQVLQLSIIIQRSGMPAWDMQRLEEFDLPLGSIAAQRLVVEELFEARFQCERLRWLLFCKLKPHAAARRRPPIHDNFHGESHQVHIPGMDDRIEERDAILIAAGAHLSRQIPPILSAQFFPRYVLRNVEKFLRHQPLQLSERLLLKNPADFLLSGGLTVAEDQIPALQEQRPRGSDHSLLQLLLTLQVREPG